MANIKEQPHSKQTICELHRRMYRELVRRNPNDPLILVLEQAFQYAKKMGNRLRQHRNDFDDGWYETHKYDGGELHEPDPTSR